MWFHNVPQQSSSCTHYRPIRIRTWEKIWFLPWPLDQRITTKLIWGWLTSFCSVFSELSLTHTNHSSLLTWKISSSWPKSHLLPWPVWLSWLVLHPRTERLCVFDSHAGHVPRLWFNALSRSGRMVQPSVKRSRIPVQALILVRVWELTSQCSSPTDVSLAPFFSL